ncbi:MAG: PAS domain S-box protein [Verrucomicrobiota bacterium]
MNKSEVTRILFAHADADLRAQVTGMLAVRHEVEGVPDTQTALEAARKSRPDLVLSDARMPGLAGVSLTQALRADPTLQNVPVILLIASVDDEETCPGDLEDGADDYLIQPFSRRELLARVQVNLSRARVCGESERRVTEALEQLNDATEAGGVGIWRVDLLTGLATRDGSMNRILGLEAVETTQPLDEFFTLILPADRELVRQRFQKALEGTDMYECEMRVLRPDGTVRWLRDRGRIMRAEDGTPVLATGAAADITEIKRVGSELANANAVMRAVAENSTDLVYVKDEDCRLIYLNPATARMLGGEARDFLGKNAIDLAGDTPQARRILENDRRVIAGEEAGTYEEIFSGADHITRIFHSVKTRWLGKEGEVHGLVAISRDITERKRTEDELRESEARFRSLADDTPVFIWVADVDVNITYANRPFLDFLELKDVSEFTGRAWESHVHPDDLPVLHRVYEEAVIQQRPYTIEIRHLIASTGGYEWNFFKGVPRFVGGQFTGFIGTGVNINELKLAEEKLRENEDVLLAAKESAEAASRAKDKFLAQLSHELRTPLTPVLMTAAALSEDPSLAPETREQLAMIQRNVALEARLIDDLLDLTRITHGKLTLHSESCDACRLIGLAVDIVRDEARQKRIHVTVDLLAEPLTIQGDPARLQQVIWNLLRNAVKFTSPGGLVRLTSRLGEPLAGRSEPASLWIEISDTGIGFSSASASRLFEPFEQGDVAGDQRFPGLGLGLAIARAIIDMHHGTITAASPGPGKGATFTVALPIGVGLGASTGVAGVTGAAPSRREDPSDPSSEQPMRILLVDDHQTTRDVLARLLRRAGHDVITAEDVSHALAAAGRAKFDVVVSDIGLPDGTGFDLMMELRARHGLRGIALSGYGTDEDLLDSASSGFVEHLVKPVTIQQVRQALRRFAAPP